MLTYIVCLLLHSVFPLSNVMYVECHGYCCSFEAKEKKYRLVDADKRMRGKKMRKVTFDLTSNHKSLLPRYVQDLVKEMVRTANRFRTTRVLHCWFLFAAVTDQQRVHVGRWT